MGLKDYHAKRKFDVTPEPKGKEEKKQRGALRFVIQKHAASHLHYDFRLEVDGVLKSWAVPKGPVLDPSIKRLAMQVEDHPMDYRLFEGNIPKGNYGAGTVMVWDEGTYIVPEGESGKGLSRPEAEAKMLEGLKKGKLTFQLHGHKLQGEFALVKTHRDEKGWLLIKHDDNFATSDDILQEEFSAISKRSMDEIRENGELYEKKSASGKSNRSTMDNEAASPPLKKSKKTTSVQNLSRTTAATIEKKTSPPRKETAGTPMPHHIKPMKTTLVDQPFNRAGWVFEIKWDGYRAVAEVDEGEVALYSRNLLPFNAKFLPIAEELKRITGDRMILDGEIVALDKDGHPSFQALQHYAESGAPLVYYVFDLLYLNKQDLRSLPLLERKRLLQENLPELERVRYCDHVEEDGEKFFQAAIEQDLEGIIAKDAKSTYQTGTRAATWLKIKGHKEQETIICGYTAPKGGRKDFGALILGAYEGKKLRYIGHTGTGFNDKALKELKQRFQEFITESCPFEKKPQTNQKATWLQPELVCQIKFTEWTDDGHMRHPVYLGMREDKKASAVIIETEAPATTIIQKAEEEVAGIMEKPAPTTKKSRSTTTGMARKQASMAASKSVSANTPEKSSKTKSNKDTEKTSMAGAATSKTIKPSKAKAAKTTVEKGDVSSTTQKPKKISASSSSSKQSPAKKTTFSREAPAASQDKILNVNGHDVTITHPNKVFWLEGRGVKRYKKLDLVRYYESVAPYILPYLKDRPFVLNRFPHGIDGDHFYQKDQTTTLPHWIETISIYSESNNKDIQYLMCQNEETLLYLANLGCIETHVWSSRKQNLDTPDWMVIDLDPADIGFEHVIETAKVVHELLGEAGAANYCKTSGATGLHIYIPMGAKEEYETVKDFGHLIAAIVHQELPRTTSIERSPAKRPKQIYLDYLQNRYGQTMVSPYSVRPREAASVSMPLHWDEVKKGLTPAKFTMANALERIPDADKLWKPVLGKGINLSKCLQKLEKRAGST